MNDAAAAEYLLSARAVRECCNVIYAAGERGELRHFVLDPEGLARAVDRTDAITAARYPDGQLPYHGRWRHIDAGAPRVQSFAEGVGGGALDRAHALFEE